jgi:hypothetical protein
VVDRSGAFANCRHSIVRDGDVPKHVPEAHENGWTRMRIARITATPPSQSWPARPTCSGQKTLSDNAIQLAYCGTEKTLQPHRGRYLRPSAACDSKSTIAVACR